MTESRAPTKDEPAEMQTEGSDLAGERNSLLNIQVTDEAGGWIYGPGRQR